jgi:hypothetical protein
VARAKGYGRGVVESPVMNGVWGPRVALGLVFGSALNFLGGKYVFGIGPLAGVILPSYLCRTCIRI